MRRLGEVDIFGIRIDWNDVVRGAFLLVGIRIVAERILFQDVVHPQPELYTTS